MAKTFDEIAGFTGSTTLARSLRAVSTLRLVLGLTALLGAIIFLEGTSWDIQWHSYIGRDRTLIPPHLMMLSGVALSGISGLLSVLIESWWARRNTLIAQYSVGFAGIFSGPLGAYVVGFTALTAAVAFPLDAYWHALYGIDVAIWAPFHIMFIASMGLVALGAAYMLSSAAHLAARLGTAGIRTRRAASLGVVLALATVLSLFTLLLFDALEDKNFINLGFMSLSVFPLLSGLLVAFTLVAAAYAIPWRWAATAVSVCYLVLAGIMALFVQPATDWLLTVEHLNYREAPAFTSVVALQWFLTPLVVAILIDVFMHRARRKQWSRSKLTLFLVFTAELGGALPVVFIYPLLPVALAVQLGIAGSLASLLLGLAGTYLGTIFGRNVGESLDSLER
ncbi:MAG: hypothetical protein E6I80_22445 [Chloroflexi bacterium]|nr:MAG: hypothetical protein E6I80_22445 [Chloroflexota bacterium]